MLDPQELNVQNFQSLFEHFEAVTQDVIKEVESVHEEQRKIRDAVNENSYLSSELTKLLAEKSTGHVESTFKESDLIENLKSQLKSVADEKSHAVQLWQNSIETIELLERELQIYQDNTQGLVPKSKLIQLRDSYEEKLNQLQHTLTQTKAKLQETINTKSRELQVKDQEIVGTLQSHDNTFKIVKNLEDEVLKLQHRLKESDSAKSSLERYLKGKNDETEWLKLKVKECKIKVEEALQIVEAAIAEKDAALLREAKAQEKILELSKTLEQVAHDTEQKITTIRNDCENKLAESQRNLDANKEITKQQELEIEKCSKKCALLELQIEKIQKGQFYTEDTGISKLLTLEKNLENTFQKLLLSEKQNIQLKSEMESIKNDLDQMAKFYERDIQARETEKIILKNEVKKLQMDLSASNAQICRARETIDELKEQLSSKELNFVQQMNEAENSAEQTRLQHQEVETTYKKTVDELQQQLLLQTANGRKWRSETNIIIQQLEKIISELKTSYHKSKQDNKSLHERLKRSNFKMLEYQKFLELISQDVTKIKTIMLPRRDEPCS